MKYIVTKSYKEVDGSTRLPGEIVELTDGRAAVLRYNGLIGAAPKNESAVFVPEEKAVSVDKNIESAISPTKEQRKRDRR